MHSARTVLVVEEEFLIALDLQRMVESRDVSQTIFARSAAEAVLQRPSWGDLALAIIEVRHEHSEAIALCAELASGNVPVIVITADSSLRSGIADLPSVPVIVKPMSDKDLASAWSKALANCGLSE